jgi:hypothetical protein
MPTPAARCVVPAACLGRGVAVVFVVVLVAGGLFAAPAVAGWGPAVRLGDGFAPAVGFGSSGDAAVGFQAGAAPSSASSTDGGGVTYLARRGAGGGFAPAAPVTTPGAIPDALQTVLLPPGGGTVLLFGPVSGDYEPWTALVDPAGAAGFGAPQRLVQAGGPEEGSGQVVLVGTARGEVVGVLEDSLGDVSATVLARGAARFRGGRDLLRLTNSGGLSLAADGVGGTFLTGDYGGVAYRPAGGRFAFVTPDRATNQTDSIAAGGRGDAVVASVYGTFRPGYVAAGVGRADRFARPRVLARTPYVANTSLLGAPAVSRSGAVTVAWQECGSQGLGCSIAAASGSFHAGLGRSQVLARTSRSSRVQLSGLVGDGDVVVERSGPGRRFSIGVALAGGHGRFGRPQQITADGQLQILDSDARGDQMIVWTTRRRGLYAATRRAGAPHFGVPHRLAASGVRFSPFVSAPDCVTATARGCDDAAEASAAFGPRREAILAWSLRTGATYAAVFRVR